MLAIPKGCSCSVAQRLSVPAQQLLSILGERRFFTLRFTLSEAWSKSKARLGRSCSAVNFLPSRRQRREQQIRETFIWETTLSAHRLGDDSADFTLEASHSSDLSIAPNTTLKQKEWNNITIVNLYTCWGGEGYIEKVVLSLPGNVIRVVQLGEMEDLRIPERWMEAIEIYLKIGTLYRLSRAQDFSGWMLKLEESYVVHQTHLNFRSWQNELQLSIWANSSQPYDVSIIIWRLWATK